MMEIEKANLRSFDVEELACAILGIDIDEIDGDESIIEEKLDEEFYIDLDTFQNIVERLVPLITVAQSPLTDTIYKGFADVKNKRFIVKVEVDVSTPEEADE